MHKTIFLIALAIALFSIQLKAQSVKTTSTTPPGLKYIIERDLKKDLYEMADPHFNGRGGGTIDELKVSAWFANKLRDAGIEPAGDDGTYFQFFSMARNRIAPASTVTIGNHSFKLWKDVLIAQTAPSNVTAPILFLGPANTMNTSADVKGKAVVIQMAKDGIKFRSLPEQRYGRELMTKYGNDLLTKGAAAIIFITDEYGEHSWEYAAHGSKIGTYDLEDGPNAIIKAKAPILWLHSSELSWIKEQGLTLNASIILDHFTYPSVNIVGKTIGTDPTLSKEYILLSGHQDALGFRNVIGKDSVYHGADDNASVTVAMLAVIRALKKSPAKRSALIVIQGSEERGLIGSRYYSSHPTVPLKSIVAVLNGDMIGRNNIDSAAVLGTQLPHMNSPELAAMALSANEEGPKFKLDTLWDKPTHPEVWYFRSDHLPYARLGIPALMYSSLLHSEYHTPSDNAQNINYAKLKKMTDWIYRTAWKVGNTVKAPAADPNFKLER